MTVPGASRSAGTSHSSLRPIAYCAGCAVASGSARSSCLVRLPRTPSEKIVTLARMSTPGSNVASLLRRACRCRDRRCARRSRASPSNSTSAPANPVKRSTPGGFDLLRQPLDELVERDDVVAVIAKRRRRDRQPELAAGDQEVDAVVVTSRLERARPWRTKSGMSSRSVDGSSRAPGQLCAPASRAFSSTAIDSGSPPCAFCSCARRSAADRPAGPAADDQHVDVEGFSFHALAASSSSVCRRQPLPSSAMSAGAISNRSPWMP